MLAVACDRLASIQRKNAFKSLASLASRERCGTRNHVKLERG